MGFEARSNLGCHENALVKMARLLRQKSNCNPVSPASLDNLVILPSYLQSASGDSMLLWDSEYSPSLRRSFLFGTQDNLSALSAASNLIIDGTFKVAPSMSTQLLTVHGLLDDGWRIPCAYALLPGKTEALYTNLLQFKPFV